ncbi:MAG TPA: MFS transporter [Oscillatoriales cyanobacterium M4454_W2019_049]|nr:MFS transporter [Oscillatoriales cyanobacterium M4454_W2019_049]
MILPYSPSISLLFSSPPWLAQVLVEPDVTTAEDAALVFSGPQFFAALVAGVVLAFAFQLLLTNLGVAAGISLLGGGSSFKSSDESDSLGTAIRKVGFAVGLGTLVSVTIALFFACLLAVKLSLLASTSLGAIAGLVIWATYFSLLVWVSSTTVGSLIGTVVQSATSGIQALLGTATAAIGGKMASQQVVATADAAAGAMRRQLTSGLDPEGLRERVEDYLDSLRPAELNLKQIRAEFEDLLQDPNLKEIAQSGGLQNVDRQTFVELVSSRSDLSKREVDRLAEQLEGAWNQTVKALPNKNPMSELVDYLKSAAPERLLGKDLSDQIGKVADELRSRRQSQTAGPLSQAATLGFNSLVGLVMGRTDLSDLDVEKIVDRLSVLKDDVGEKTQRVADRLSGEKLAYNPLRADIENYLRTTYSWQMKRETIERDFRNLLYDPAADPQIVAEELRQWSRSDFADILQERGVFTQAKIFSLSRLLDGIRLEVLAAAEAAIERDASIKLLADVEHYLLTTPKTELTPEKIQIHFKPILEDADATAEQVANRCLVFDRPTLERILEKRGDISSIEASAIISELETARDRTVEEAHNLQVTLKNKAEQQWRKVQAYLRDTGKGELNPDSIERELKLLLDDPNAGFAALRERSRRFDRDTLVKLLSARPELSEAEVENILDTIERNWTRIRYAPKQLAGEAKAQYDRATSAIAQYLRGTGKAELNPEGIRRDLNKLLDDPQTGFRAIRHRLAMMDRDTLVQLLAQRDDLSEEEVNRIIDEVQSTLRQIAKAPQRLARRAQLQVESFQEAIADYLRSTDKAELSPAGIERDVKLLLNDPRAGMESLNERLAHFDRSTFVALLAQRDDISEAEANQIVDRVLESRDRVVLQFHAIQERVKSLLDGIFDRIRTYLNNLDRPELNYDGIKRDIATLFDDPEAGFDALRTRLSKVDRETLIAVLSSRDDISPADADRLVSQIERTRDRVLQKADRLQREAQIRLEEAKMLAQKQMEETRKAAAAAAWWLFLTATVSAIASAGAGAWGVLS